MPAPTWGGPPCRIDQASGKRRPGRRTRPGLDSRGVAVSAVEVGHQPGPAAVAPDPDPDVVEPAVLHVQPVTTVRGLLCLHPQGRREDRRLGRRVTVAAADVLAPRPRGIARSAQAVARVVIEEVAADASYGKEPGVRTRGPVGNARAKSQRRDVTAVTCAAIASAGAIAQHPAARAGAIQQGEVVDLDRTPPLA